MTTRGLYRAPRLSRLISWLAMSPLLMFGIFLPLKNGNLWWVVAALPDATSFSFS
jgi:hypothetical protein